MKLSTALALASALAFGAAGAVSAQQPKQSGGQASAQKSEKGETRGDAKHLKELAQANMAEVEAGKLAAQKAQNADVKKFAQQMVDDHNKQLEEIRKLAQTKGVELPSAPDSKHQRAMKKLQSASPDKFDHEYMGQMVKDHRDALKLAQRTAKDAKDTELKSSAEKAAPEIEKHLQMARQLESATKGAGKKSTGASKSSSGEKTGSSK